MVWVFYLFVVLFGFVCFVFVGFFGLVWVFFWFGLGVFLYVFVCSGFF